MTKIDSLDNQRMMPLRRGRGNDEKNFYIFIIVAALVCLQLAVTVLNLHVPPWVVDEKPRSLGTRSKISSPQRTIEESRVKQELEDHMRSKLRVSPQIGLKNAANDHVHSIPNNVIFTHYVDLLRTPKENLQDPEDVSLQANVLNTISLHPGANVYFYTDEKCVEAIKEALNDPNTPLVDYFLNEKQGMYKADICRGAALYNLGGLYFDVDIQARMNVFSVLDKDIQFVTPTVHSKSNWKNAFFQAFIGVTRQNPIMLRYLDLFVQHYNGQNTVDKGPLGVILLRRAFDQIRDEFPNQFNNVVLWEETKYYQERFPSVEPTIGKRRACHFLVAIPNTGTAVFYSRVRGSRMCGGKESTKPVARS